MNSPLGTRMLLWIGKTIPMPPPKDVADAFVRAEITSNVDGESGFQLSFTLGRSRDTDYALLQSGALDVSSRVVVGIVMGAMPSFLIDGLVMRQEIQTGDMPGEATLTVTGRDVTVAMDLEDRNDAYPNQPDFFIVARILTRYAQYGFIPDVTPTTAFPIELQRIPRQAETDLQWIRRAAQRNGFVFHVEPITMGVNRAYFGPELRADFPHTALAWNCGPSSNVDSLSFAADGLAPTSATATALEPISKTPLSFPALTTLRLPPLSLRAVDAGRASLIRDAAKLQANEAPTAAIARKSSAPEAVTCTGEVDGLRYGDVLRPRGLVGVRGVGTSFDGLYYVRKVTHRLDRGSYRQNFTISREGTTSLLPVV
jgi:hypothetical protein